MHPHALPPETVDQLVRLADSTPLGFRGTLLVLGSILLLAGERLYRLAIVSPGIIGGILLGAWIPIDMDESWRALVMLVLAAVGALTLAFLEKVAVVAMGALVVGGLVNAGWPLLQDGPAPWWALAGGGLLGLLLFPHVFRGVVKLATALLGALTLAYAVGLDGTLRLLAVAVLGLLGVAVQLGSRRRRSSEA